MSQDVQEVDTSEVSELAAYEAAEDERIAAHYPKLIQYSDAVQAPERDIMGRDYEISQVLASLERPEVSNVLLIADPGTGKSALVQAVMLRDTKRKYLEVDVSRLVSGVDSTEKMAAELKALFDEAQRYTEDEDRQLVLFFDEFHQIMQLSDAAVEALKPVLAASGARGIRVIAATTYEEFHIHISKNQPLVERLQRINLSSPDRVTTIAILKAYAERYNVADHFYDEMVYHLIYEYTDRYIPASSQPRKSLLVLDSMIGWHRHTGRVMDRALLADVLRESVGVNITFRVDGTKIEEKLNTKIFGQRWAIRAVTDRMQVAVADLHDKSRPISSFLFTGSTGVGKTELAKQMSNLVYGDAKQHLIRFDMSEYSLETSIDTFRSEITRKVWDTSHAVILIDEIEKAASNVIRLLLQVLDDGRLSDDHNREVSFLNTYIIMTTNAGSEIYKNIAQYNVDDEGSGEQLVGKMREIRRSIRTTQGDNRFPPELLGRIDQIVPFQPLSWPTLKRVVETKMLHLVEDVMRKHGVRLHISPDILTYLVDEKSDNDSDEGGARGAIRVMNEELLTKVAQFINYHPEVRNVDVKVEGRMRSEHTDVLVSESKIVVQATGSMRSS